MSLTQIVFWSLCFLANPAGFAQAIAHRHLMADNICQILVYLLSYKHEPPEEAWFMKARSGDER